MSYVVWGLDMRFLGRKSEKKKQATAKAIKSVASPCGLRSGLRQSGLRLRRGLRRRAEARLYLKSRSKDDRSNAND
jgi:hypothetical protein